MSMMAPKQIGKWAKYGKRYCGDWEGEAGLKDWVQRVPGDDSKAACKYCICEIRTHHSDLVAHSKTKKHKKHVALLSQPSQAVGKYPFEFDVRRSLQIEKSVAFETEQDEVKHAEMNESVNVCALKMAAHIACHMSIFTVDHLGCIIGGIAEKDISLHRTKCSAIIRDIIGPAVHKELLRDVGNGYYSLIIDESLDVSSQKQLCLMVRYFSSKLKCIVTSFVGIITLAASDSNSVTDALLPFINENKLNISKCVGIAADALSASICDHENSLLKKFYELNPCGVFIKCIWHSLYLCLSRAIDVLPLNLEYMISHTYLWFSQSTFHQKRYSELYAAVNVGENALKMLQFTDIQWLSIGPCINRILSQYDTLRLHFQSVKDNGKDYSAELLYQMYSEPVNRLYLVFLQPFVQEANRISKLFLLETANPVKLITEIVMFYQILLQRIVKHSAFPTWSAIMDYDVQTNKTTCLSQGLILDKCFFQN
ncbi:hypothetical protein EYD10_10022 [Varanus komodoensis]|nr:hypothetical protein EYD10_10022 [Varanus komodoensis]